VALGGATETSYRGVGAHQTHLEPPAGRAVACTECHLVPSAVDDPGHIDSDWPAEVSWAGGEIAGEGAAPFDADGLTCTVYCHGATLSGGTLTAPVWTEPGQAACGTCHGDPPPPPHPAQTDCQSCHPGGGPGSPDAHVDGVLQLTGGGTDDTGGGTELACDACHGQNGNPAPPPDTRGSSDTSDRSVGAHATHGSGGAFSAPVACDTCHQVPATVDAPGHIDDTPVAEVELTGLADQGPGAATWNPGAATCTVYCHDGPGASVPAPIWTRVDGSQADCGACHSLPPPSPHPNNPNCGPGCHPNASAAPGITDPSRHIDGEITE
jgi:predicted CxxxxCH...CXXCH cytochrome family protein